ncbi:MAG TPA: ATP-binding protein, partial [Burkholderiaceae bacterium]|nr:ATP-binding protein [Burkholderiaceae bacterium]
AADASLLRQLFVNLLSNAYKFTVHAKPARIEVSSELQSAEWVYLVRDNGAGFDMARAGRLFGAFERLHSAEEFEGNGVGLSIVQRIVQRHGGRIWAQAAPGRGASFFFTLGTRAEFA